MSDERLLAFSRAFADSARSGLPPAGTLLFLKLKRAAGLVSEGKTVAEALAAEGRFPPVLLALVRAGEESGKLDEVLDRYSAALETRIDFRRRLKRALGYPVFAAGLAATIFVVFTVKVLPMLLQPIVDAGMPLPPDALKAIGLGKLIIAWWPALLGAFAAAALTFRLLWSSRPGRKARALAGHWLPGIRYATEEARFYQFESTMELLLGAGLRPRQLMEILQEYFREDPLVFRRLSRGAVMLTEGKSFTESVGSCLPEEDRSRVAVAEKAGRLDETLGKLAVTHRDRHLYRLKVAAGVIQMASIVALAPVCFGLTMWILSPAMAMMGAAVNQGTEAAGAPRKAAPLPMPVETSAASRFNEEHAGKIVGFMREHGAGASEAPKPMPKLKLKTSGGFQFKKIEPTAVKSSLN
jgi:type IV pilus assembly protein PilC